MISDEILMAEFRQGSRPAFEELFARYRQPLYGFFRRRLESGERAEDLTQETFLAVIRAHRTLRTDGIAWNLLATERRRQARDQPSWAVPEPASIDAPDEALWVRQALERLDPVEREILMLRQYEQLSYSEIAGLLHVAVNTVRSRLFRSRMALKNCLEPAGGLKCQ